jgi:hypothetical protein
MRNALLDVTTGDGVRVTFGIPDMDDFLALCSDDPDDFDDDGPSPVSVIVSELAADLRPVWWVVQPDCDEHEDCGCGAHQMSSALEYLSPSQRDEAAAVMLAQLATVRVHLEDVRRLLDLTAEDEDDLFDEFPDGDLCAMCLLDLDDHHDSLCDTADELSAELVEALVVWGGTVTLGAVKLHEFD